MNYVNHYSADATHLIVSLHHIPCFVFSLSPSVMPSTFHSKLKPHMNLHHKLPVYPRSPAFHRTRLRPDVLHIGFYFYRAMHFSAKRGIAIACRLSVCLSVTLVDSDHIGWDSSKIISPSVSLGCSLFAAQTSRVYSKGNTLKFSPE